VIEILWGLFKCQETSSIALLVWRLTAWPSRQADGTQINDSSHSASRAPGGRDGSARRNGAAVALMVRGAWRQAGGLPGGDDVADFLMVLSA